MGETMLDELHEFFDTESPDDSGRTAESQEVINSPVRDDNDPLVPEPSVAENEDPDGGRQAGGRTSWRCSGWKIRSGRSRSTLTEFWNGLTEWNGYPSSLVRRRRRCWMKWNRGWERRALTCQNFCLMHFFARKQLVRWILHPFLNVTLSQSIPSSIAFVQSEGRGWRLCHRKGSTLLCVQRGCPCGPWNLKIRSRVLKHFRILNAADAERFHEAFKTSSWFRAVKTPLWRSVAKPPKTFWPTWVTCTVSQQLGVPDCNDSDNYSQEFSRAASGNGVRHRCQAMLFILNICTAPSRSSAACMRISVVTHRTHEKLIFCCDCARSIITSACPSVIDWLWGRNGNFLFDGWQTIKRSVCANVRHALYIPDPITPGHIDDPCAPNVSSWHSGPRPSWAHVGSMTPQHWRSIEHTPPITWYPTEDPYTEPRVRPSITDARLQVIVCRDKLLFRRFKNQILKKRTGS